MGIDLSMIVASMAGLLFGSLFARLFVKITPKRKFVLTPLGTTFFGDPEGPRKQFVGPRKGAIIAVIDVVLISIAISYSELFVRDFINENSVFALPLAIFLLNTIYLLFSRYSKMKTLELSVIGIIYLVSIVWGLVVTGLI